MPDSTANSDSSEQRIDELEERLEELHEKNSGKNRIEVEAYDLSVTISSEDEDMETLAELASEEMDTLTRRALIGEYQELEREGLFDQIIGGD